MRFPFLNCLFSLLLTSQNLVISKSFSLNRRTPVVKRIDKQIDCIISPALGGVLVGYELAKSLNCNFVFYERINNEFELRRGFELDEYSNVLFVEDVITTGKSTRECLEKINHSNVNLLGIATLVDRSKEKIFNDSEIISLLKFNSIPSFLTSSLNKNLRGSTNFNFIFFGNPPTL